jgi:hypothetical protein
MDPMTGIIIIAFLIAVLGAIMIIFPSEYE